MAVGSTWFDFNLQPWFGSKQGPATNLKKYISIFSKFPLCMGISDERGDKQL